MSDKTACRTPAKGRDGVTNIPTWKFDLIRGVLLDLLAKEDIPFSELTRRVGSKLSAEQKQALGSVGWHMTTVKLEMEVRGELSRLKGSSPQIVTLGAAKTG